jgi:hypothetical protein
VLDAGHCQNSDDCDLESVPVSAQIVSVDLTNFTGHRPKGRNMPTQLKRFLTLSFVGIFMLVMSQTSRGQNLLVDPGFELGIVTANPNTTAAPGWAFFGGSPYEGSPTQAPPAGGMPAVPHTGDWDLEMPWGGAAYSVPGAYEVIAASAMQTYTFSGYVRTPNVLIPGSNDFGILQITYWNGPSGGTQIGPAVTQNFGTPAGGGGIALPQNAWEFGSVTALAPAGTQSILVYCLNICANSNAYFAFDDLSLTLGGTAPPAPGDYNKDGHVDARDINALDLALTNLTLYQSTYTVSNSDLAAINNIPGNSGSNLSNSKLQALENLLLAGNGSTSAVPEPSSLVLLALGGLGFAVAKKRLLSN